MACALTRREFLAGTSAAAAVLGLDVIGDVTGAAERDSAGPNEDVRVACVGIRGRGRSHMHGLESASGSKVVALCDVDPPILGSRAAEMEKRTGRKVKRFADYRKLLEDRQIDAVTIATPNHTHGLIAVAAMQAGKDVYVEKPCSHNVWEGRQLVAAARKHNRICQHGTQGRSSPALCEAIAKLHEGVIGEVHTARAVSFKWRPAVGPAPEEPVPPGVDYDLWLGPARKRPFSRHRFHYHWRWHWDYGNGDLGNQGVHEIDLARWGLGVGLPGKIRSTGRKFMFDDAGETPGRLITTFDFPREAKTLVFESRDWIGEHERSSAGPPGAEGVTFYGSEGCMHARYFEYATYLGRNLEAGPSGKGAPNEYERFIAGVRSRRHEDLGADIEDGHLSSALCHLGNIAYRLGRTVCFDPETETFPGDHRVGAMLSREYRRPYVVPEIV
ncbi:MAG: Gfo/Idh/MocA family protein [Planctomycetota bacterium]|jgi:predicted dehydrogenase